jgi:protein-tyrosine-phosphatase
MKKIMFVCMGNICRSPLAEAIFGTIEYHVGEPSDPRMREVARRHGVFINHRAQALTPRHLDECDAVLCMDRENLRDVRMMAKSDAHRRKIALLRDYDPEGPGDVPDPYYGGKSGFETVYAIVSRSCEALFLALEQEP